MLQDKKKPYGQDRRYDKAVHVSDMRSIAE